jgi:cytochrome c oxidase assembly protein subunit 15
MGMNRALHRFAAFTTGCTFFLLMAGALVTSNDAGLAVPDWPLSYGSLTPPMIGRIFYEHGHRVIATLVGILTIILAVWIWRAEKRAWIRRLGWGALALVIAQGLLGGLTVKLLLPPPVSMAHATLAQLFFVTLICLTVFTGDWWQSEQALLHDAGSPSVRALALTTSVVIVIQTILGAGYRHGAFGIWPHLVGAGAVTAAVVVTGRVVRDRFREVKPLRRAVIFLHAFFGLQVILGGAAWWAVQAQQRAPQPLPLLVTITVAHVLGGALTLASSVVLTLRCYRLIPAGRAATEPSGPEDRAERPAGAAV